jgi:FtsZ-binding cell division protein ZapB
MENLHSSNKLNTTKTISKLADKINSTCIALLDTLSDSAQSVWNFWISITQKLDSELVDRVIKNIQILQIHISEIKNHMNDNNRDSKRIEQITTSLRETSDNLNEFVLSNNFFYNTFGWYIWELRKMIDKVLEKLPIWAYKLQN